MQHLILRLGILLLASGCTLHRLSVQTQYIGHENLASFHVGTPDPRLYAPMVGQRLLIQWSLCAEEVEGQEVFLNLKVRFRNHEEHEVKVPITSKRGTYLYEIANEAYDQSKGILTYYAEIRNASCVLASWRHPLWTPLITFDFPNKKESIQ
jgi:hypothetical protein